MFLILTFCGLFLTIALLFHYWDRRKWHAETPLLETVDVAPFKIAYRQTGQGPDLILLHGIGASHYVWRFLVPLLEGHFRITIVDLPGFGQSSKLRTEDYGLDAQALRMHQFLTTLKIPNPILIGNSMGGTLALWMARTFPEQYKTIVCLAPSIDPKVVPRFAENLRYVSPLFFFLLNRISMRRLVLRVTARPELVTSTSVFSYLAPFQKTCSTIFVFFSALTLLADRRLPMQLDKVNAKLLVLWGHGDRLISESSMHLLVKICSQTQVKFHPNAGHHLMEDEPRWTAEQIFTFFESLSSPPLSKS